MMEPENMMEPQNVEVNATENSAENKPLSKKEIIARLGELAETPETAERQELESLKQNFYKLRKNEVEKEKAEFLQNGGDEAGFVPSPDNDEPEFKRIMGIIKEKKSIIAAEQEKLKQENLEKKQNIINRIKELSESEDVNKVYNEFRQLREEWNEIKLIPQNMANELWKNYQLYVEKFYDMLKINNEFRTYDFKKNLEKKIALCEAAEKLADEPDVISAFYQLQNLHQEYRETGPVAPEMRDEIWNRFKAASTVINKRHQQHFEEIKEKEQANLDAKTVICEIVESINNTEITTYAEWDSKTNEIIALQAKWKTIGFAPQKMNSKIFERFRSACDTFFKNKGEFYKRIKEDMSANLNKKLELCEKAEKLKDSTAWKETAEKLAELQKEWKTIGPVAKKQSEVVWKRFIDACDHFFQEKNKVMSSQKTEEAANLEIKKGIIAELEAIDDNTPVDEAIDKVKELQQKWNETGHVPFKDKDKLYKQYHKQIDKWYDNMRKDISDRKLSSFRSNINGNEKSGNLYKERERLERTYQNMTNELKTYENNLNFLNISSKGNSLLSELNRKVEKLKADIELTLNKIKAVNEAINNKD